MESNASRIYERIDTPPRIYLLGTGSVGKLLAHSIRSVPDPPPVTLLFHRPSLQRQFVQQAQSVIKITTGKDVEERSGFQNELVLPQRTNPAGYNINTDRSRFAAETSNEPITNLIVSVKANRTISALRPLLHRLSSSSNILFMQNGMGVLDEVNKELFPDPSKRPTYISGVNTHGIFATSVNEATHAGQGTIMLGMVPRVPFKDYYAVPESERDVNLWNDTARYLMRAITRVPVLAAVPLLPTELLQAQLEKLAINCVINPLTVMLDCRNGDLVANMAIQRSMFLLLAEISLVIQSLPELQSIPNIKLRFSPERLEWIALDIARKTGDNISSMLQDMRRGAKTEIEYINGYIVKRGEEMGIKPVMNYLLMQMVNGKQQMVSQEIHAYAPFKYNTPPPPSKYRTVKESPSGRGPSEEVPSPAGRLHHVEVEDPGIAESLRDTQDTATGRDSKL